MADLENIFKSVRNNSDFNLGFGQKPLSPIPINRPPVDIGSLGPLLPGSPDPIDQHMAELSMKQFKKPPMPQFPMPKPDIPPTQIPNPIAPPFIPSPITTPYMNPINAPITRQDLTPNPNQTVILRNKKKSVAPKRKSKKVVKKLKK